MSIINLDYEHQFNTLKVLLSMGTTELLTKLQLVYYEDLPYCVRLTELYQHTIGRGHMRMLTLKNLMTSPIHAYISKEDNSTYYSATIASGEFKISVVASVYYIDGVPVYDVWYYFHLPKPTTEYTLPTPTSVVEYTAIYQGTSANPLQDLTLPIYLLSLPQSDIVLLNTIVNKMTELSNEPLTGCVGFELH